MWLRHCVCRIHIGGTEVQHMSEMRDRRPDNRRWIPCIFASCIWTAIMIAFNYYVVGIDFLASTILWTLGGIVFAVLFRRKLGSRDSNC